MSWRRLGQGRFEPSPDAVRRRNHRASVRGCSRVIAVVTNEAKARAAVDEEGKPALRVSASLPGAMDLAKLGHQRFEGSARRRQPGLLSPKAP